MRTLNTTKLYERLGMIDNQITMYHQFFAVYLNIDTLRIRRLNIENILEK